MRPVLVVCNSRTGESSYLKWAMRWRRGLAVPLVLGSEAQAVVADYLPFQARTAGAVLSGRGRQTVIPTEQAEEHLTRTRRRAGMMPLAIQGQAVAGTMPALQGVGLTVALTGHVAYRMDVRIPVVAVVHGFALDNLGILIGVARAVLGGSAVTIR